MVMYLLFLKKAGVPGTLVHSDCWVHLELTTLPFFHQEGCSIWVWACRLASAVWYSEDKGW